MLDSKEGDDITPINSFDELPIFDWLKNSLKGIALNKPTPIQRTTILAALKRAYFALILCTYNTRLGRDVIGAAPTGSGKTLCFVVPILQSLAKEPQGFHSLVLTPTRELAFQIADQFRAIGAPIKVRIRAFRDDRPDSSTNRRWRHGYDESGKSIV